ncbi:hypothetical protein [Rhodanobacter sp. T12-5]|uniref:hypothetical protein n=1 Tax=Rhodanobacter sp. T12-5 TaxID=2024611 RepID=UPI0011EF340B|nr:hypothetical protein [Rhodanobacter sp. T12-5]KAA0068958.1 hypothetical protein CIW53_12430 [Rhodanobacter sp. T12-5]KAA0068961.1 hypothetical protein CIW53_12445 [Rhodanobacter sp. T12-5]
MKGRTAKPYTSKTLLNAWRQLLEELNRVKADPACDLDPAAVADVTDYLLDRIDAYRPAVALENAEKNAPDNAPFATPENPRNNRLTTGAR